MPTNDLRKRKGGILGQMANDRDAIRHDPLDMARPPKAAAPAAPAAPTGKTHGKFISGGPKRTVKDWYKLVK